MPWEDRSREETCERQGMPRSAGQQWNPEADEEGIYWVSEGAGPCGQLDFRIPDTKTMRQCICCLKLPRL